MSLANVIVDSILRRSLYSCDPLLGGEVD